MAPGAIDTTHHAPDGRHNGDIHRDYNDDRNASSQDTLYTTSNGVPMPHPYETQRVGENGPLLLQDFPPDRSAFSLRPRAHPRAPPTQWTTSAWQTSSRRTSSARSPSVSPTVGGESGTPDLARDPRGFSVKFRTDEANSGHGRQQHTGVFLRDPVEVPSLHPHSEASPRYPPDP
ncbi:hypothetical protein EPUL_006293, partial [Erysiphe pulchra]